MKEKERDLNNLEVKEGYAKQEVIKENKNLDRSVTELREYNDKIQRELEEKNREN